MNFYGYKNHIKVDQGTKLIGAYAVSDAEPHDSQELETLIDKDDTGRKFYADSAYIGKEEESIEWCNMTPMVQEKATAGKLLTKNQKSSNRKKSQVCARGVHVFGFLTTTMHALSIHTVGMSRATAKIGLSNHTYSMMRNVQLKKRVHNVDRQ